jgi:hypothetical protein
MGSIRSEGITISSMSCLDVGDGRLDERGVSSAKVSKAMGDK